MPPQPREFRYVNFRGVWTLYYRELKRALKIWVITLASPAISAILFAAIFSLALGRFGETMGGMAFATFLIPGLIAAAVLQRAFEATAFSLVFDKMEGTIDDTVRAPLAPAELVLGYTLASATGALLVGIIVGLALVPFGTPLPSGPWVTVFFAFAGSVMISLFAQISGLWARKWDHISAVQTFAFIPFVFLAGVFFPLDRLPPVGQLIVRFNPMFYVVDGVRFGMTGHTETAPVWAAGIVIAVTAALAVICLHLFATGYRLKD